MLINQNRLVDTFMELVKIDSFAGEERSMADNLFSKLKRIGFTVTEDDAGSTINGTAGNIIGKLTGDPTKPTLLFCAHMDRVAPGNNIQPQINHGVITSDGTTILAADDVAGIVAILEAVQTVKEQDIPHGPIEVVFTIAEEGGLNGAKALDSKSLGATFAYFLDTGGPVGTIINQAPYQKNVEFTIYGKAAHAGINPEKGLSAILVAADALRNMNLGRISLDTTANIGIMHAGVATNIIPDQAYLKGEARSLEPILLQSQIDHMVHCVQEAIRVGAKLEVAVHDAYPGFNVPITSEVIKLAVKAADSIGLVADIHSAGGGSDANILNSRGIPSVILGVNFKDVHSKKESIAVSDLALSAQYVAAIIENA